MELNREQIIKALECCTHIGTGGLVDCVCDECPYCIGKDDCRNLDAYALALIKELTEENERLKAQKYYIHSDDRIEMIPTVESVKSDTVREMQERLENRFDEDGNYFGIEVHSKIDQIAKEMLEGEYGRMD